MVKHLFYGQTPWRKNPHLSFYSTPTMPKRKIVLSPSSKEISIGMPREYSGHFICAQMRALVEEEALHDTRVTFKNGGASMKISAFMLCITSPVFHKMVCGGFKESMDRTLELQEVEEKSFRMILDLACGKDGIKIGDVQEVLELATLADRFQMPDVVAALEDVVLRLLNVDVCADVLSASTSCGLSRMMEAGRALALTRFEEVSQTEGFMSIGEDTLCSLLDDDGLAGGGEERIFEALVRWMRSGKDGVLRGTSLLSKIRFPLMDGTYLAIQARQALPDVDCLKDLIMEACMIKVVPESQRAMVDLQHLCPRACVPRLGKGVAWEQFLTGGEVRLNGHARAVNAMVAHGDRVCSGSEEGAIRVWNKASMRTERTLPTEGSGAAVRSLLMWQGHVISGTADGKIIVWDLASGTVDRRLHGHTDAVTSLAVWGTRLVSGSWDFTMKVWAMGTASTWPCERTIEGHTDSVHALAIWEGRILSGSEDSSIRVWDAATGAHQVTLDRHTGMVTALAVHRDRLVTLDGHTGMVTALVVHRDRLVSSSWDGRMIVWRLGTWELLQTVTVYAQDSRQQVYRLIRSGCKLVSGSTDVNDQPDEYTHYEVRVWDLETLQCQFTLRQPAGAEVLSLLGVDGEVWAGVFNKVVVWGREA